MFGVDGDASRVHKSKSTLKLACARRRCRCQPCFNASHRLCCSRSQTLSSILPRSRPDLPNTPANCLSDLCDHSAPSRHYLLSHRDSRSRSMIHGHLRAASKIVYIHSKPISVSFRVYLLRGKKKHLLVCVSQSGLGAHRRSTATDLSPNTYHTPGTLLNRLEY